MKIKIISLLICTLFITSIFTVLATAKNLESIDTSVVDSKVDFKGDLIKIIDGDPTCDMDSDFVVYGENANLYIYNIETEEINTIDVGGNIVFPKISEHRVVYYDFLYMGFKMYDIETGEKTDLIVTNWEGGESDAFQFFGDYIVYENYDPDIYSTEIYLYNIATSENIQLTDNPGEDYSENPCIYNNFIAWQFWEGNLADIVMYSIDSEEYTRVTNTSEFESETFPSIYDKVNGTILYGLKMYNIDTEDETTLFTEEKPTGSTPEIFGNIIAYSEPGINLRLLDLLTNINTTIYEGDLLSYPWNLNGNYIVFTIVGDGVYLYEYNDNNPPDPPEINGPASGKPGISYDYVLNAVDPDGDQVKYVIDWGDGDTDTTDLNQSGIDVTLSHIWSEKGDYTIKIHAQDEYGLDGDDATFSVTMPRSRSSLGSLFFRILERFPNVFPIFRYVLEYSK